MSQLALFDEYRIAQRDEMQPDTPTNALLAKHAGWDSARATYLRHWQDWLNAAAARGDSGRVAYCQKRISFLEGIGK